MNYIRTKDGIYEVVEGIMLTSLPPQYQIKNKGKSIFTNDVISQADTIEDLIMPHDLVKCGLDMYLLEKDSGECLRTENMRLVKRNEVDCLWIAVGEDIEVYPNFKLVAEKNEETGKLELL